MESNDAENQDDALRRILDRAIEESADSPMDILAAVLGAVGDDQNSEELNLHGQLAGEWRLLRVIGVGGMGVTYEARDHDGIKAAVKVVGRVKAGSLARFEAECKALEHLYHQGVVQYLGRGRLDSGKAFMVMEFVDGCHLGKLVEDLQEGNPNPVAESFKERAQGSPDAILRVFCELVRDVAKALESIHKDGIVHRDIKPGNIMVRPDLRVVIIDFGLSKDAFRSEALTRTAAIVGTLQFMAPEQGKSSSDADRRADVYSLGLVLAHCVGGFDLLDATSDRGHPWRVPHFIREAANQGIPKPIQAILRQAIQFHRQDRYRSANALAQDLDRYLSDIDVHAKLPSRLERLSKHPRFRLITAVLLTAMVAVTLTILFQPEPYLVSIDTTNDGGTITIDGDKQFVAPIVDLELEPGEHVLVYEFVLCRPVRRKFIVDRHHLRINLKTIGKAAVSQEDFESERIFGVLNIKTGSLDDRVWIDGKIVDQESRWHTLSPGWHDIRAEGTVLDGIGGARSIHEAMRVFVEPDLISSALLLPIETREIRGDYRFSMRDIGQTMEPAPIIDLDDGLVFWMNDFRDNMAESDKHVHVRTCITPVVINTPLTSHLRYEFPVAMKKVTASWRQVKTGPSASISTSYRFGDGPWHQCANPDGNHRDSGGTLRDKPGEIPTRGVTSFELKTTMVANQRPGSFSTTELFFGYFDKHSSLHDPAAFAIVAQPVGE